MLVFLHLLFLVFTKSGLHKEPTAQVPPQETFKVPVAGTMNLSDTNENHRQLLDSTISRLRQRVEQRRILLRPVFQDFDP